MPKGVYVRKPSARRSEAARARCARQWADPDFAARMAAAASERMTRLNADPDFKAKSAPGRAIANQRPDRIAANREAQRALWDGDEGAARRTRYAAMMTERMADPVKRAPVIEGLDRGLTARIGPFRIPEEWRRVYRNLRARIGTPAARLELFRLMLAEDAP